MSAGGRRADPAVAIPDPACPDRCWSALDRASASLVAGGWLIWVGTVHAEPAGLRPHRGVHGAVSDTRITATLTVDRPTRRSPVVCRVLAQAADFQPVGRASSSRSAATADRVVNVEVDLTTLRRATTAVVRSAQLI